MPIEFHSESIEFSIPSKQIISKWIGLCIQDHQKETGDLNIIFTCDNYLLDINKKYLDHHYYTDIVTFDYCTDATISGDLFLSIDTIRKNSVRFSTEFTNELNRVIIHGVLHLLGFDDQSDEQKAEMRQKEDYYLERLKKLS